MEDIPSLIEEVNEQTKQRNAIISKLESHLGAAQKRMKLIVGKRSEVHFEVKDLVYLRLKP